METIASLETERRRTSTGQVVGCFLLLLAGLHLAASPIARFSQWKIDPATNPALAEALAWREGRLDLPHRMNDTALYEGRVYNVNPPLLTLLAFVATGIGPLAGVPQGEFYTPWYVMMVALPLPLAGYWMFLRAVGRPSWAAFFTAAWILATPVLPCLSIPGIGGIHQELHLLSQAGLMLIAGTLLRGGSLWPGVAGLLLAAWSRPLCFFYAIPLLWAALRGDVSKKKARVTGLAITLAVILAVPMGLSWARFGSPFDSGYRYLYEGREGPLARIGREAARFSIACVPQNAWDMHLELPGWEFGSYGIRPVVSSRGASIWYTMPLLLFVLMDVRRWWRSPATRRLMLTSLAVMAALLLHQPTGMMQPGYDRASLDFLPVWLAVVAVRSVDSPDRWKWMIAASAWSMVYFRLVSELYAR